MGAPSLSSSVGPMDSMVSMLRDIKSGPNIPLRDDDLSVLDTTMNSAPSGANMQNEPDAALNAASPEPQASEASLHSSAQPLHSGRSGGRIPLGPVLQQGGQRVGEVPRQQPPSNRGNNGRILFGDPVDGTWEVRVNVQGQELPPEGANGGSRGSKFQDHNTSQQSWNASKSFTPRGARRPVHIVHRHHHHHYHHHYFPVEGDEIPATAFVEGSIEEVSRMQPDNEQGRFAPSSSLSATPPPATHDSSEHRHFHYHHHAQSIGIPAHAQKLLDASNQHHLEAENALGTSPIPLSGNRGVDTDGTQDAIYNTPGTRLPSLI